MAGVVPFSGGPHGRKQWNIRDRKSSRRLRSQLAEDGCPESQLVLAKQLLQEKSVASVDEHEENARLGVFWLIKASEQGNVEATNILRQCLETGEGITEHNYLDVKACLNTSQNEKLAKRAAREMFMSLSAGQDFISSEQLRQHMKKINLLELPSCSKSKTEHENTDNDCSQSEKKNRDASDENGVLNDEDLNYSEDNVNKRHNDKPSIQWPMLQLAFDMVTGTKTEKCAPINCVHHRRSLFLRTEQTYQMERWTLVVKDIMEESGRSTSTGYHQYNGSCS